MESNGSQSHVSDSFELLALQNRISELENLVVNSTLHLESRINNGDDEERTVLLERISDLENLLAASELENQKLAQILEDKNIAYNRDQVKLLDKLRQKDEELLSLQYNVNLFTTKFENCEKKLNCTEEYIKTLPSLQEYEHAVRRRKEFEHKYDITSCLLNKTKLQNKDLKQEILQKDSQIKDLNTRILELQPLEEAEKQYFESFPSDSLYEFDKLKMKDIMVCQKSQLVRAFKLIDLLKKKVEDGSKKESQLGEIINQKDFSMSCLNDDLHKKEAQYDSLQKLYDDKVKEKEKLLKEVEDLEHTNCQLKSMECSRKNEMNSFTELVVNLELCVSDLKNLNVFFQHIVSNEIPPASSLLAMPDPDPDLYQGDCSSVVGPCKYAGDSEWVLDCICQVSDLRKEVQNVRTYLNDLYTEMLSKPCNIPCKIQ